MKQINTDKFKNIKPNKLSFFKENMSLLLRTYPQCYDKLGMWRKLVSQTSFDPEQFAELIIKSTTLPVPYNHLGYVRNQLMKNKKQPEFAHTLFGFQRVDK